jgi:cysteine synthase
MIELKINETARKNNIKRCVEKNIIYPTFEQMKNPTKISSRITERLKNVGLWDVNPLNLFRITWKNEPKGFGGGFGDVNYIELPTEFTGVKAKIIALVGKWFPTGAHKVGATYGCLAPALVSGNFDSTWQKAVWPSTGCQSIAILPEEMSSERFEWLRSLAGEVIATPGCESNVKEIFDKCWELKATRDDVKIFNQFEEFGNYLWHFEVTGNAIEEVFLKNLKSKGNIAGFISATGSGGTIAAGDYLKLKFPHLKIAASEALQCPTLLLNGYGGHRIEGIGDKHVPWIHNVKNTDVVIAIDDNDCIELIRLFNEEEGKNYLIKMGVPDILASNLDVIGISGVANILSSIKFAKYFELNENDVVFTVLTDSMELYGSRIKELNEKFGKFNHDDAVRVYNKNLMGTNTSSMLELSYYDKKRIHNLKYFTWIEQQKKDLTELNSQWFDYPSYWEKIRNLTPKIDEMIKKFNEDAGLL